MTRGPVEARSIEPRERSWRRVESCPTSLVRNSCEDIKTPIPESIANRAPRETPRARAGYSEGTPDMTLAADQHSGPEPAISRIEPQLGPPRSNRPPTIPASRSSADWSRQPPRRNRSDRSESRWSTQPTRGRTSIPRTARRSGRARDTRDPRRRSRESTDARASSIILRWICVSPAAGTRSLRRAPNARASAGRPR